VTNHRFHLAGGGDSWQGRCSCKQRSKIGTRSEVEDWGIKHLQEIERIRAHLGTRSPSLKTQCAWFFAQADDPENPPEDRVLWRQLADELDRFIAARSAPVLEQDALF
jgi:hypothetical protein